MILDMYDLTPGESSCVLARPSPDLLSEQGEWSLGGWFTCWRPLASGTAWILIDGGEPGVLSVVGLCRHLLLPLLAMNELLRIVVNGHLQKSPSSCLAASPPQQLNTHRVLSCRSWPLVVCATVLSEPILSPYASLASQRPRTLHHSMTLSLLVLRLQRASKASQEHANRQSFWSVTQSSLVSGDPCLANLMRIKKTTSAPPQPHDRASLLHTCLPF